MIQTGANNEIQVDLNNLNVVDGSGNAGLTGDVSLSFVCGSRSSIGISR